MHVPLFDTNSRCNFDVGVSLSIRSLFVFQYASWDLAFHCIAYANVDIQFAKDQLLLFLREWYMHPNGQVSHSQTAATGRPGEHFKSGAETLARRGIGEEFQSKRNLQMGK